MLERQTLHRHHKGGHKNDPGRSRPLYGHFAALFDGSTAGGMGQLRFGVEEVGGKSRRAYIEQAAEAGAGSGERYYVYAIWQEAWTTSPVARSKFVRGKLVYQRDPNVASFFARPYEYRDGHLAVPAGAAAEESLGCESAFPPNTLKRMPGKE